MRKDEVDGVERHDEALAEGAPRGAAARPQHRRHEVEQMHVHRRRRWRLLVRGAAGGRLGLGGGARAQVVHEVVPRMRRRVRRDRREARARREQPRVRLVRPEHDVQRRVAARAPRHAAVRRAARRRRRHRLAPRARLRARGGHLGELHRREAGGVDGAGGRAELEQRDRRRRVAALAGRVERRAAVGVGGVDRRPQLDEHPRDGAHEATVAVVDREADGASARLARQRSARRRPWSERGVVDDAAAELGGVVVAAVDDEHVQR